MGITCTCFQRRSEGEPEERVFHQCNEGFEEELEAVVFSKRNYGFEEKEYEMSCSDSDFESTRKVQCTEIALSEARNDRLRIGRPESFALSSDSEFESIREVQCNEIALYEARYDRLRIGRPESFVLSSDSEFESIREVQCAEIALSEARNDRLRIGRPESFVLSSDSEFESSNEVQGATLSLSEAKKDRLRIGRPESFIPSSDSKFESVREVQCTEISLSEARNDRLRIGRPESFVLSTDSEFESTKEVKGATVALSGARIGSLRIVRSASFASSRDSGFGSTGEVWSAKLALSGATKGSLRIGTPESFIPSSDSEFESIREVQSTEISPSEARNDRLRIGRPESFVRSSDSEFESTKEVKGATLALSGARKGSLRIVRSASFASSSESGFESTGEVRSAKFALSRARKGSLRIVRSASFASSSNSGFGSTGEVQSAKFALSEARKGRLRIGRSEFFVQSSNSEFESAREVQGATLALSGARKSRLPIGRSECCDILPSSGGSLKMVGAELFWPSGALDNHETITLTFDKPSKFYRLLVERGLNNDQMFGANVIHCQPDGLKFNKSLTMKITLDKSKMGHTWLVLHGRKADDGNIFWEDITDHAKFNLITGVVRIKINGFSLIAVMLTSIWVRSKEIVTRLNFMSFKYTLAVLHKTSSQNCPSDELALIFMSQDVYQEKHYREHDESVFTKLKKDGFKELGSTVRQESKFIYNKETLTVSLLFGEDYKPVNNLDESLKFTVDSSVWWSTGHAITLKLQSSGTNSRILCGKIHVQGQYGHVRVDHFCELDLRSYVRGLLGVENLISNLKPVAEKLQLSAETWRQVVSCWKDEQKQLEIILLHWRENQGDKADPTLLRKNLKELEPEAYRVKERGQMHIRHLRELATTIDCSDQEDLGMMEYLSSEIKNLCGSIFRDCCIEMESSKKGLKQVTSTEYHLDILVTHGKFSKEVLRQYEEICSSSVESITEHFLSFVPHLIQPIKEIFKHKGIPQVQNGMKGIAEEITLENINSEIQDALKENNIFGLFTVVTSILECLCHSNNTDQSQITDDEIREWGSSIMIIRMLEFLDQYFETAGSDALRLCKRLHIFSIQLKNIMKIRDTYGRMLLTDFYNVALSLVAFAKFDPTRFLRFELKDSSSSVDIRGDEVLRYDKLKEIFSQLFWIRKESDDELQLEAIAYVHIGGKLCRIGAFESKIILPALTSEVIDRLSMASLPVVVRRENGFGGSMRVTLYATQKESLCKAFEYLKQELGEEAVNLRKERITSSHLKLRSFAKAGTDVKLRLIHKWGSETIGLDSHDFIALADSSAGGACMPDAETAAEVNQLAAPPTAGDLTAGICDASSFVMDTSHAEMVERHLNEERGKIEIHYHQSFMKGHVCVAGTNTNLNMQMPAAASDQRCLEAGPSTASQRSLTAATTDKQED